MVAATAGGCAQIIGVDEDYHGFGGGGTGGASGGGGTTTTTATCDVKTCPAPAGECKVAACDAMGQCGEANADNGTVVKTQVAGDCKKNVCMDGAAASQNDDTDTEDDGQTCTDDSCVAGVVTHVPALKGTACTENNGKVCDGAGVCITPPSCNLLAATCGPAAAANESCCAMGLPLPGGTYYRTPPMSDPATVDAFRLDRFEITVGRFRAFVQAYPGSKPADGDGAHPQIPGSGWNAAAWNASLPADQTALKAAVKCDATYPTWTDAAGANENLPMNCLNWYDAFAFCAWDGGRLPTEAEWGYAAAYGAAMRPYPWGATVPTPSYAVYDCTGDGSAAGSCAFTDILKVGSKSATGDGGWQQADLAGSVFEWTLDWYAEAYQNPCTNCVNLTTATYRVIRGGSWYYDASSLLSSSRSPAAPTYRWGSSGARCARTS